MHVTYFFGDTEIDPVLFEVRRGGHPVPVEPQVFDVLRYLVQHRDRVVSKEELLDSVWGDRFVSESALTSRIKEARRAVGDDGQAQRVIRTARRTWLSLRRGGRHRPTAGADTRGARRPGDPVLPDERRRAARVRATIGEGPPLVKAANWLSHLDYDWESPVWRHWWRELSQRFRFVRYDDRGCGLSDRVMEGYDLDTWVHDLETVVNAAGLEQFALLGVSRGGPVAIAYAARHPERLTHLVLYGTFLRGRRVRATRPEDIAEADVQVQLARLGWGRDIPAFRQVFAAQFIPNGSRELWDQFDELQRRTTTADIAAHYLEASSFLDATPYAPLVRARTLVLHARGDRRAPVEEGRRAAALIPGSRFVTLDGDNHILLEDEPAWPKFIDEVARFLAE